MFGLKDTPYKRRLELRKTINQLRKIVENGESLKQNYTAKAKKALAENAFATYQIARSGLKTTMMQTARAEQMLTTLELMVQHADFAQLSSKFIKGMNTASKELIKAAMSQNFEKAEKIFQNAMGKNETAELKMDSYLSSTNDRLSTHALSTAIDAEIDKTIGTITQMEEEKAFNDALAQITNPQQQSTTKNVPLVQNSEGTTTPQQPQPQTKLETNPSRPQKIEDFLGQADVENKLPEQIHLAKKLGQPLPHIFIYGQKGLGKTTIAQIIANEMGGKLIDIHASTLNSIDKVINILKNLKQNDVLFIDEIHCLSNSIQDAFLKPIEEFEFTAVEGKGQNITTESFHIPPFTMIGATTENGEVRGPLVDRLKIKIRLEPYSPQYLAEIIKRNLVNKYQMEMNYEDMLDLAGRCRGTPRIALNFCQTLLAKAAYKGSDVISRDILEEFYTQEGVDNIGLLKQDRALLTALITKFNGGPTGIETLANAIGDKKENVMAEIEPYLNKLGFLSIVSGGRIALAAAYDHLNLNYPSGTPKD